MSITSTATFIMLHVPSNQSYSILDDAGFGGLEFHLGSGGKQSPFRIVLPAFDDTLLDEESPNGWAIEGGDEIQIYMTRSTDLSSILVYDGMVVEVEPIVGEENSRVLQLSGVNFGDYWLYSRVFEKDYRTHPEKPSVVIRDIIAACHPNLTVLDEAGLDILFSTADMADEVIGKNFVASYCGKALQEVCAAYNFEYYVTPSKLIVFFPNLHGGPVNDTGIEITEDNIIGKPNIKWTDDGYHYDEVIVDAVNLMYGPNNASPTGTSICDNIDFWEARMVTGNVATGAPTTDLVTNFIRTTSPLAGVFASIELGYVNATTAISGAVAVTVKGFSNTTNASNQVISRAWRGLGFVEADWRELNFGFLNNLNLGDFRVRLNHGINGATGYWISPNLVTSGEWPASKGVNKPWHLLLPSQEKVVTGFWTPSGSPTIIDEVQFIMERVSTNNDLIEDPANSTMLTYFHFSNSAKAASNANVRYPERQLLLIDRTFTQQSDVEFMADSELERVRNSALSGNITFDGILSFVTPTSRQYSLYPGWAVTLDIPYYGLNSLSTRIDHVVHRIINGRWMVTIAFGPFLTEDTQSLMTSYFELKQDLVKE